MRATGASFSEDSTPSSFPKFAYALSGVVRHLEWIVVGHYVADVPDESTAAYKTGGPEKWRRCDDLGVTATTLSRVLADRESPYLLFYQLLPIE